MCVMHYSLIFQAFPNSIIMWTSYLSFIVWLDLFNLHKLLFHLFTFVI